MQRTPSKHAQERRKWWPSMLSDAGPAISIDAWLSPLGESFASTKGATALHHVEQTRFDGFLRRPTWTVVGS